MAGFKIEDTPKHWLTISWNVLQKKRQTSDQTYKRGNSVPLVLTYYPRLKKVILYFFKPKNKSRIYLHFRLLFHFAQVLILESIWLGLKYTLFYVNVYHLVVTKVDVKLALMLTMRTFFRVLLQRRVTK